MYDFCLDDVCINVDHNQNYEKTNAIVVPDMNQNDMVDLMAQQTKAAYCLDDVDMFMAAMESDAGNRHIGQTEVENSDDDFDMTIVNKIKINTRIQSSLKRKRLRRVKNVRRNNAKKTVKKKEGDVINHRIDVFLNRELHGIHE